MRLRRRHRWLTKPRQPELARVVSARHQLPELIAQILLNRGLVAPEDIDSFLTPTLSRLLPPETLQDLPRAVARLVQALERREAIIIYGDYDVDGLTATALLQDFLQGLGARVSSYIPDRLTQGYGLSTTVLAQLRRRGQLLLTVDCGVSNGAEIEAARALGLEVIVTDHHEPPAVLPPALAVVNPKRSDCPYPFKELTGVGLALHLALGVRARLREQGWFRRQPEPNLKAYLDLVALGTAADVAPLLGVNRILVSQGLQVLAATTRPGLAALKELAGLQHTPTLREVIFRLAPRLNAPGRLGQPRLALELLLAEDRGQAWRLAQALEKLNQERQRLEATVLEAAESQIRERRLLEQPALIISGAGWHLGVLGIVAARLVERYHRPVILLSFAAGLGRGSARAVPGFDLYQALAACQQHLEQFGGHAGAAGLTLREEALPGFAEVFLKLVEESLGRTPPPPELLVDAEVSWAELDDHFFFHLNRLRPFGQGNPPPVLACPATRLLESWVVGDRHLKLKLAAGDRLQTAIAFDLAGLHPLSGTFDLAISPRFSCYQGECRPELQVVDLGSSH